MADLTPEQREQRYRRAREVIEAAGWLFDDYVNREMAALMKTDPSAQETPKREGHFHRARLASEMKLELLSLITNHETEAKIDERRSS